MLARKEMNRGLLQRLHRGFVSVTFRSRLRRVQNHPLQRLHRGFVSVTYGLHRLAAAKKMIATPAQRLCICDSSPLATCIY